MDFLQLIFLGLLIVAGTGNCFVLKQNRTDGKLKIEGGEPICIDRVPYQVYLKEDGDYVCGGALIKPNIVLTSAHCVTDLEFDSTLTVVAGTDSTELIDGVSKAKGSYEIFPEAIIVHPMYNEYSEQIKLKYDIAVIKLEIPFRMTKTISTISMPTHPVKEGERLLLTGIGVVDEEETESSCLKAYEPIAVRCEDYLVGFVPPITNSVGVICHKSYKGYRSRAGDSGSPLVDSEGILAGIHRGSTSTDCQVAVDLFYHLDWIEAAVGVNTNEVF